MHGGIGCHQFFNDDRRHNMKHTSTWVAAALVALSGAAFAQSGGAGGAGGSGGSTGGGGAGMATGNDTGAQKAGPNSGGSNGMNGMSSSSSSKMQHHSTKTKQKPMNDTTNMPGADASSDTKGQ
jgi:hypothetical protein